jgi:RNA polymerase sigma factor (sigma-70 family)
VEIREKYLKDNYNIDIELLLEKVDEWETAGDVVGTVLRLRYIDGMTYEQIAEATGLSRDQVKRILAKGKERLQDIAKRD